MKKLSLHFVNYKLSINLVNSKLLETVFAQ